MPIKDKVALVTGGSGGLGKIHSLTLARAGCKVALTALTHPEKGQEVVEEIKAAGGNAMVLKMDVGDLADVQQGAKQIEKELGPISILVNNAAIGIAPAVMLTSMDNSRWDADIRCNLTGPFNTIKTILPGMMERGWGRIINISSITGTMGGAGQCSYAASKAGLLGLTKTVALEAARKGVTCNAVVLGVFWGGSFYYVPPEFRDRIIKRMALRRAGDPQELSNVIAFLVSEEASYVTGTAVEVSGGANLFTF